MCTIGSVFYKYKDKDKDRDYNSIFKQCDLTEKTQFLKPYNDICKTTGIRFVAMRRKRSDGSEPAWAGVNQHGVAFVAADSYLENDTLHLDHDNVFDDATVFDMYLATITHFTSAKQAAEFACSYYKATFRGADIFMVCDMKNSYYIEAYHDENICQVSCIERKNGFFASTNHFRMLYGGVPFSKNHSTYLRLNRAEQILQSKQDLDGIGDVLRDKYFGETAWSICRSKNHEGAPQEQPYYTQAAVIFSVSSSDAGGMPAITCEFVLNDKPDAINKGYKWQPIRSPDYKPVEWIGKLGNLKFP